ncbi:MAG: hypothetical protein JW888_11490, partial [Pirellulales bacterium]|nr:hypothetical protein [Pirellulales bacterium]
IVVHKKSGATVPLRLGGGVLALAKLDGQPARLSVAQPETRPAQPQQSQRANSFDQPQAAVLLLHVPKPGRHVLDVQVRLRLARSGGWHLAQGIVPSAPASSLALTVPGSGTDVQLSDTADRRSFETDKPDERIETVLAPGGGVRLQWRAKLSRADVQRSLTARSDVLFDVQEDGTRLVWDLVLEFRRDQRQQFAVGVPGDYLVENVEGSNVRGWKTTQSDKTQRVEVTLLKPATDTEHFLLRLRRDGLPAKLAVPAITVEGAAIETGRIAIRRSPLLEVQTVDTRGVGRTDFRLLIELANAWTKLENPLGLRDYQAYRFASMPFSIGLAAAPIRASVAAEVQTIVKISDLGRHLESMVNLDVRHRPIFQAAFLLPDDFTLDEVMAPGEFQWALTEPKEDAGESRQRLTVYFAAGQQGEFSVILRGKLGQQKMTDPTRLPRLEVLDVDRQEGDMAVQVDPSFRVSPRNLKHCETVLLRRLHGWLKLAQRQLTQLALHTQGADYDGRLVLARRKPRVRCTTTSNLRVTERALEETILLDFTINEAGIRRVVFTLPHWMKDARISVPLLRQKTIEPMGKADDAPLRVTIDLQDEVINQLRVLVENDRLPGAGVHTAPIPTVLTGETTRRLVSVESAGRDEVVVDDEHTKGMAPLNSKSGAWRVLKTLLGDGITQAYAVAPGAKRPRLAFTIHQREAVVTAGARIGLAETDLLIDASGAYRGRVVYHMDNSTEQFLPIELPRGARLWSALVADEPVKPIRDVNTTDEQHVRIPLVKTSAGELDYRVVLVYGGKMDSITGFGRVVDFPLLRMVDPTGQINLSPELSQVRLHLPKAYRWFDFDGTMRRVHSEGQWLAGQVAYQNDLFSRLEETMRRGDQYAKARAAKSARSVQSWQTFNLSNPDYVQNNRHFKKELASQERLLRQVQQQVEQIERAPQKKATLYNRSQMNISFDNQQLKQSRGAVEQLGKNWGYAEGQKLTKGKHKAGDKQPAEPRFEAKWLEQNALVNKKSPGRPATKKPQPQPPLSSLSITGRTTSVVDTSTESSATLGIQGGDMR